MAHKAEIRTHLNWPNVTAFWKLKIPTTDIVPYDKFSVGPKSGKGKTVSIT